MQLRPLLIAPLIGIAVCLFVLSVPQVVQVGYPMSWSLALGEIAIVGLYMVPAAYIAEFGLSCRSIDTSFEGTCSIAVYTRSLVFSLAR